MSYNRNLAAFNPLLSLAYTGISSSYALVGTVSLPPVSLGISHNMKDGSSDLINITISFDGITDHLVLTSVIPGKVWDVRTNAPRTADYMLAGNLSIFVKTSQTPASGSVYVEALCAQVGA